MRTTVDLYSIKKMQSLNEIVKDLFSKNFLLRKKAREELVEIGEPSLDLLIELAENKDETIRWEALKIILQIGSNETLDVLLSALKDDEFSIRWLAAEGIINLGRSAIVPLLKTLQDEVDSTFLRRGAHHILKEWRRTGIFKDNYALIESLANEFDHSDISLKLKRTISSLQVS